MKFAHIADCHLGAWSRKPELQELNIKAFEYSIDKCIQENVDFILLVGDLFNTSFPTNTSLLSRVFSKLRQVKEKAIPIYLIPGSHDFSASGESILKVCEAAGFCKNLMGLLEDNQGSLKLNFFEDEGKKILITGVLGKRIGLEIDILKRLNKKEIEEKVNQENSFKIFLLHSAVSELLPEEFDSEYMKTISCKELPEGFDYYAFGHIHEPKILRDDKKIFTYSGCTFPNNFKELSHIRQGSFIIVDFNEQTKEISLREEKIKFKDVVALEITADDKTAKQVEDEIIQKINEANLADKIFTLKVSGTLRVGKISDINFEEIYKLIQNKACFSFLRNTHGLLTKEFKIQVSKAESVEEIEKEIIENSLKNIKVEEKEEKQRMINSLIKTLDKERLEDETKEAFSSRLINELLKSLDLQEKFK